MTNPFAIALLAVLAGWALLCAGVFLLSGLGWALVTGSVFFVGLGFVLLRGLTRA